ncbi:MAG: NUDIX hydrolase, partial [Hyphomicrobiaceae bacterium]|nr:NUDIX hydrolase [Hyphomicrobiaceae bacterium]
MTTAQKRRLRPRDAASLIVLDRVAGGSWRVLMGRRRADLAFMPGKYVFPGGRVDRTDDTARAEDELEETVARRLAAGLKPHQSLRRARGLALAAVRETFEETGHFLGAPFADKPSRHSNWKPFHEAGYVPRLSALRYLARAV